MVDGGKPGVDSRRKKCHKEQITNDTKTAFRVSNHRIADCTKLKIITSIQRCKLIQFDPVNRFVALLDLHARLSLGFLEQAYIFHHPSLFHSSLETSVFCQSFPP